MDKRANTEMSFGYLVMRFAYFRSHGWHAKMHKDDFG